MPGVLLIKATLGVRRAFLCQTTRCKSGWNLCRDIPKCACCCSDMISFCCMNPGNFLELSKNCHYHICSFTVGSPLFAYRSHYFWSEKDNKSKQLFLSFPFNKRQVTTIIITTLGRALGNNNSKPNKKKR